MGDLMIKLHHTPHPMPSGLEELIEQQKKFDF